MNYHNITSEDMLNGDGLRTVLWVAGCSHHCEQCHNPETWNPNGGIEFDDNAMNELIEKLSKSWCSGLTLSGGDPLHEDNRATVLEICKRVKSMFPKKTIWLYTGYEWENVKHLEIMQYISVLVDGKFDIMRADINYRWAGSTNQRVIDVIKSTTERRIILYGSD